MGLDYDLDRRLRLKLAEEMEHKTLYDRAVIEMGDDGSQIGLDMIPWGWTLNFQATDLSVSDRLSYETKNGIGRELPGRDVQHRHGIHAKLKPGGPRQRRWDHTTYRLFGTDRVLEDITLDITPTSTPEDEGCTAWATASYTSEIDFRNETQPDCLCFYMSVSQTVYDRYVWNIAQGLVNELVLSLGFVDGFYAPWSPGISTDEIKILAGSEHIVEGAEGADLLRLGKIGKVELAMNARSLIRQQTTGLSSDGEVEATEVAEDRRQGFRWLGRR